MKPSGYFGASYWGGSYFGGGTIPGNFWEALVAYVNAQMAATLTGGFSAYRDPPGVTLPYGAYAKLSAERSYDSASSIADGRFEATFYASSEVQANALAAQFDAAIKDPTLLFADGTLLYCRAVTVDDAEEDPDPGPQGEDVFASTITVHYAIDRDT
jgi:hypothetical protein